MAALDTKKSDIQKSYRLGDNWVTEVIYPDDFGIQFVQITLKNIMRGFSTMGTDRLRSKDKLLSRLQGRMVCLLLDVGKMEVEANVSENIH